MKGVTCQSCRARHLECDKAEPKCIQCQSKGLDCIPGFNARFRRSRNPSAADAGFHATSDKKLLIFEDSQVWIKTPKDLSFVDETSIIAGEYEDYSDREDASPRTFYQNSVANIGTVTPAFSPSNVLDSSQFQSSPIGGPNGAPSYSVHGVSPAVLSSTLSDHSLSSGDPSNLISFAHLTASPALERRLPQGGPLWLIPNVTSLFVDIPYTPFDNPKYAFLLRHFQTAIGKPWFDVTDQDFTSEVLRIAPSCPVILCSLLALAAIHLSRMSDYDANEAEEYHEQCIRLLLPMLNDKSIITEGAVLASSALLRFYEEMSAPIHGSDDARHLIGGVAFVAAAQEEARQWNGLRNAALWVHQRQDVHNAIFKQRPTKTDLDMCGIDRSMSEADECIWSKRATCLTADVVTFAFGPNANSETQHMSLRHQLDQWNTYKPATFVPMFFKQAEPDSGKFFPEIWLALDPCVTGLSYWHLAMLLLEIYNPSIPRIGSKCLEAQKHVKEQVLYHVRILCGLACSNHVPPARVVACLAISECGSWFADQLEERQELLRVLRLVETEDAWPGVQTEQALRRQWQMEPLDDT